MALNLSHPMNMLKISLSSESPSVISDSLWPHGVYSPRNSPGQNTRVGRLFLLQGLFQTQGLNPGLLHCRQILYQLSYQGSPTVLEWAAYPFSRASSWPRNWTQVSRIAGRFSTSWATGKPKNTGVGSLSLVQRILPTQGLNMGLLHCRRILDQLSHREAQECLPLSSLLINSKYTESTEHVS